MVGIYTIGGGEIIYEVLNAVSLLLNGGSGTLRALITIGAVSGIFVIYYMFVLGNIEYIAKKWAIPLTIMLSFFFVPQTTVWVHMEQEDGREIRNRAIWRFGSRMVEERTRV